MRERPDPLVPILGSAVALVVAAAITLHFYPRISRWIEVRSRESVDPPPPPDDRVPVWVCRPEEGVALLLETGPEVAAASALDQALRAGPRHLLRLTVYNFAREEPYALALPPEGYDSPEGGPPALPAVALAAADPPPRLRVALEGLGFVDRVEVPKGRTGKLLLVVAEDPSLRTAFVSGALRFERRQLERRLLAAWQAKPDWKGFQDF